MFHLTARVAWHDSRWDGTVCRQPSCNSFCAALDRIREARNAAHEDALGGKRWNASAPDELPAGALIGAARALRAGLGAAEDRADLQRWLRTSMDEDLVAMLLERTLISAAEALVRERGCERAPRVDRGRFGVRWVAVRT